MSVTTKQPPDLLSMPNEVLANICAAVVDDRGGDMGCGRETLRAIRLTCKQLYPPATTEFAKRFLTTLSMSWQLVVVWKIYSRSANIP